MDSSHFWYLEDIIDFAGTFPPAAMDAAASVSEYLEKQDVWAVGNLAWKCSDLSLLTAELSAKGGVVEVAAIGRPRTDALTWKEALRADLDDMQAFLDATGDSVVATYECRTTGIDDIETQIAMLKPVSKGVDVYLEVPWNTDIEPLLASIAENEWLRPKLRTGGLAQSDYPSAEALATFISQCVDLELEFKMTAGLHSPLAHDYSFGFLNILFAAGIAFRDDATQSELVSVLTSSDRADWKVKDTLAFRGNVLSRDDLDDARSFFGSFGCCSIDDPINGMKELI